MDSRSFRDKFGDDFEDAQEVNPSYDYLNWEEYGDEFVGVFLGAVMDFQGKRAILMHEILEDKSLGKKYYLGNQAIMEKLYHAKPGYRYAITAGEKVRVGKGGERTFRQFSILEPKGQSTPKPTHEETEELRAEMRRTSNFPG